MRLSRFLQVLNEARHQWDTPQFRAWFGTSKAVDAWNRPMVFYHGTASDFEQFSQNHDSTRTQGISRGYYFTPDREFADSYTDSRDTDGSIMPVYLRATNPLRLPTFVSDHDWVKILGPEVMQIPGIPDRAQTYYWLKDGPAYRGSDEDQVGTEMIALLKAHGYDAVVFPEKYGYGSNGAHGEVWCVFDPAQIKSAVGNKGAFAVDSPNLTEARA